MITSKEDCSILQATKCPKMDEVVNRGGEISAVGTIQAAASGRDESDQGFPNFAAHSSHLGELENHS